MMFFLPAIKRWLIVLTSFFVGIFLMFVELPLWLSWMGSLWVVLILLYWALMMPQYVSLGVAWLVGFFLDFAYNVTVGEHALGLVIVTFLIIKFRHKILPLGFLKTSVVIFGLILIYQTLLLVMQVYTGNYFNARSILGGAFIGGLVWSPLALLLFNFQRKF